MKSFNIGVRINLNKVMNDIIQKIQEKIKLIKGSKPSKEEIIKDLMLTGMYLHELEESNRLDSAFNGLVKEGKEYIGTEADVAEYNDIFMRGEMGLDTDGVWPSTINVARKNYALLTDTGKVKLTGNSIKSKKLQITSIK